MLYALLGRRARARSPRASSRTGLLVAGLFFSWSWLVWWFLTRFVVGLGHPPALVEEPLEPARAAPRRLLLSLRVFVLDRSRSGARLGLTGGFRLDSRAAVGRRPEESR